VIPQGGSGAAAPLTYALAQPDGTPITAVTWNDVGGGITDWFKVRLPGGAYANTTIARHVHIGGGIWQYELASAETGTVGRVYYYAISVPLADNMGAQYARTDDIVNTGGGVQLHSGTAQAGAATSITLAAGASASDGRYVDGTIVLTGGVGAGQQQSISGYVGATRIASVPKAWTTNPDNTTTYVIVPGTEAYGVARAVWEQLNLEGSYKGGDLMRGVVSLLMGIVSGFDTDSPVFRDLANTKNRVSGTTADSGRTVVTINDLT
jgi:hypothetical protein